MLEPHPKILSVWDKLPHRAKRCDVFYLSPQHCRLMRFLAGTVALTGDYNKIDGPRVVQLSLFSGADEYWNTFRSKLIEFIKSNGGEAAVDMTWSKRY